MKIRLKILILFSLIISSIFILSCSSGVSIGDKPPSFTLEGIKQDNVSLEDYLKEKVVILYFADIDDRQARVDSREMQKYYQGNEHRIQILGIMFNSDLQETARFARRNHLSFPILLGNKKVRSTYGIKELPKTLIIDYSGRIAYERMGTDVSMESILKNVTGLKEQEPRTAADERPNAKYRLRYWRVWEGPEVFEPIIQAYEEMNPDVDIVYTQIGKKTYMDNLLPSLEIDQGPDMCEIHASWLPHYIDELQPIPTSVMTPEEYNQTFYDFVTEAFTADEKQWAIALGANTLALFYHKGVFREAGLDPNTPPKTWDEMVQYAKTIKEETGKWGIAMGSTGNVSQDHNVLEMFAVQNGAVPITADNSRALVNSSEFVEALEFYTNFIKDYNVWSESAQSESQEFIDGNCGMVICGSWYIKSFQNNGIDFGVEPVPQKDPKNPYTHATFWGEVVSEDCENPEIAWDFLKFCAQKENMLRFFRATLRPPTRRDLAEIAVEEKPIIEPFMDQTAYAGMWFKPWEERWKEIQLNAIKAVLNNVATPRQALMNAAEEHNETIASYTKDYDFSRSE